MTTPILIGFSDIPFASDTISATRTYDDFTQLWNTVGSERYAFAQLTAAAANVAISYDLGADTKAASFIYLARADSLKASGCNDLLLEGDDNSGFASPESYHDASFASATLYGPRSHDYIATFAATAAYRYWRVTLATASTSKFPVSKIYFGTMYDCLKAPDSFEYDRVNVAESSWYASAGTKYSVRSDETIYRFKFGWKGVTDEKIEEFQNSIGRYAHRNLVILYAQSNSQMLDGNTVVMCRITDARARKTGDIADYNELEIEFEEALG